MLSDDLNLNDPEVAKQFSASIQGGIERVRTEMKLTRDASVDFGVIEPDMETIQSYVRGFYILLQLLLSTPKNVEILNETLDDLDVLCELLKLGTVEEVDRLVKDEVVGGREEDDIDR